ncbi:MAG TPA: type II toxin-antitoxin system RelE/ParE family toxin [Longimicrobium sp.]|nr:type II toxin-antitoxin system RelE/ParE family toxin [Longimicrobium sp.]
MRVHWTESAAGHLTALHDYIARDSTVYARRMVDRLTSRSKQLARFPQSGRMVPEYQQDDVRELIEGPYRIIYRILPQQIDVLAVVHGARELPVAVDHLSSLPG